MADRNIVVVPFTIFRETGRSKLPPKFQNHTAALMCSIMGDFHNILFRSFNALYLQAPLISINDPRKASNFLLYSSILCEVLHEHHDWEENSYYPAIEEFANRPGLFQRPIEQHQAFDKGLKRFHAYVESTLGEQFDAKVYQELILDFAPVLNEHMLAEPDVFLQLTDLDSDALQKVYKKQEEIALAKGDFTRIMPLFFGCTDKEFRIDGLDKSPHTIPWILPYLVHYIFSWRHRELWQFNPSDFWGNRKPEMVDLVWNKIVPE